MHYFVLRARRDHPLLLWFRTLLEAHQYRHLSAENVAVEFDRLLAAAVKEQVRLDLHDFPFPCRRRRLPS